jgi:hypothetical protein
MAERQDAAMYEKGTWVEIHATLLEPSARATQVPDDTRRVPLEMRAKGFLAAPAALGEEAEIETVTGRRLSGILLTANPAYEHGFGPPITALVGIGLELKTILQRRENTP